MKLKIQTYKYEKVPVKDDEVFIPDEPFYCFQTGIRRAVRIIPEKIEWEPTPESGNKKGDIWRLNVTCVYNSLRKKSVEQFNIQLCHIEDYINSKDDKLNSEKISIAYMLYQENYDLRTKEQFEADLNAVISKFQMKNEMD